VRPRAGLPGVAPRPAHAVPGIVRAVAEDPSWPGLPPGGASLDRSPARRGVRAAPPTPRPETILR
jgi:hypothetical protein